MKRPDPHNQGPRTATAPRRNKNNTTLSRITE